MVISGHGGINKSDKLTPGLDKFSVLLLELFVFLLELFLFGEMVRLGFIHFYIRNARAQPSWIGSNQV